MPKGRQRTPDQILAALEAQKKIALEEAKAKIKELDAQIQATRPKVTEAKKREQAAEQFAIGRLVLPMLGSDTTLKRRLVEAASKLDMKDKDRVALARVLGKLPEVKGAPTSVAEAKPDAA